MINDYEATKPITTDATVPGGRLDNDDVISTINGLIETCKDGQAGFIEAAEGVERSDLKTYFNQQSLERSKFAGDLQTLVQSLGGDPEKSGSFSGSIHRGWINIKSAVTGKDDGSILNECERGEDSAKSTYAAALKENLPDYIREVVQKQYDAILIAHDKVKGLRDAANNRTTSATSNR